MPSADVPQTDRLTMAKVRLLFLQQHLPLGGQTFIASFHRLRLIGRVFVELRGRGPSSLLHVAFEAEKARIV